MTVQFHTPEELASSAESLTTPWDTLRATSGTIECDLADVMAHIEDSLASGDFPVIDGLTSQRLGATVSAQFDEQTGTLLIATNETQVLLSPLEAQALFCLLHSERDALYGVLHKEFSTHIAQSL
jgi:hypothetical protein